jgi:hypothetical protein
LPSTSAPRKRKVNKVLGNLKLWQKFALIGLLTV